METLRRVCPLPQEGLGPGGVESSGSRGVAQGGTRSGQEVVGQMGTPVCLQQPGPRKDIPHQTPDQIDQLDALQRALLVNTSHMYDDVEAHLQEMLDIGTIQKSHSPWAGVVVLIKKDRSLRFFIDTWKLNNQTVKDVYSLCHMEGSLDSLQGPHMVLFAQPEVRALAG